MKRVKTLDEFGCWLNAWGDLHDHKHKAGPQERIAAAWVKGYEQAVSDAMRRFEPLNPDWDEAWSPWVNQRGEVLQRSPSEN